MTIVLVVVAVVLVLGLLLEFRSWRQPRSSGAKPGGPEEMRQHVEHEIHAGHSFRSAYRRVDKNLP